MPAPSPDLRTLDAQTFAHFTLVSTERGWQASVATDDVTTWHVCIEATPESAIRAVFDMPLAPLPIAMGQVRSVKITNVHTGYNASVDDSPYEFATTPSEAVAKAIRLHGARLAPPLTPPPY